MASSEDDMARITELLDEKTLAVAIAAACGSPSKTFKMCQTLGVTIEVEKIAKSVSKLKRDSVEQFGMNWLSKILELLNQKLEFEELQKMKVSEINWGIHDVDLKNLWVEHFINPWRERLLNRTKRFRHDGEPLIISYADTIEFTKRLASNYRVKKVKADDGRYLMDGNWLYENNDYNVDLKFAISVYGNESRTSLGGSVSMSYGAWVFDFVGYLDPSISQIDAKNYRSTRRLSRVEFITREKSSMRKIRSITNWLEENNLVYDSVIIKKEFV